MKKLKFKAPKEKPFAGGEMTNAKFFGSIRSALRRLSRWWPPIQQCKIDARRPNQSANNRLKYEYKCAICGNYFPEKEVICDHIIPAGSLTKFEDLPDFCRRLFVEKDGLQILCKETCHSIKTKVDNLNTKENRKGNKENEVR